MKRIICIIFLYTSFHTYLFSQSLIQNGDFSQGTKNNKCITLDGEPETFNGIDYWEMAHEDANCVFNTNGSTVNQCPTADWVSANLCGNDPFFQANHKLPSSTSGTEMCIGLGYTNYNDPLRRNYKEGIRGKLNGSSPIQPGRVVHIALKIANSTGGFNSINESVQLTILFTKFAEHWNSSIATTANVKWEIIDDKFKINANEPEWFFRELYITVPDEVEGGIPNDLENVVLLFNGNTTGISDEAYMFVDDVKIEIFDPCNNLCTPDSAFADIQFRIASSTSDPNWRIFNGQSSYEYPDQYGIGGVDRPNVFAFNVRNATSIKFKYLDGYGAIREIPREAVNVNVLKLDGYDYYQYWYYGTDFENEPFPINQEYTIYIHMNNCHIKTDNYVLVELYPVVSGIPTGTGEEDYVTELNSCCDEPATYNDYTFPTKFYKETIDYIRAGTTGTTIVNSNSKVRLYAQNELTLGKFFSVKPNADFRAGVTPCGLAPVLKTQPNTRKPIEDSSSLNKLHASFSVYPNPNKGREIYLKIPKGENELEVSIYNMSGIRVFETRVISQTDVLIEPDLPSGVFMVQVKSGDNFYTSKLCVIK